MRKLEMRELGTSEVWARSLGDKQLGMLASGRGCVENG
jgi:hypothetical protein